MTRRVPLLINRLVDRERQRRYRGIKRRMLGCEPLEGRALLVAQMLLPTWDADSLLPASPELRPYVPQEIVVALRNEGSSGGLQPALRDENTLATNLDSLFLDFDELLRLPSEDGGATTIATLRLGEGLDVPTALERLRSISGILWAAPNYIYGGDDPREWVPNDPQYASQYHHPLMNNDRAWDVTRGESNIIVAITDDGVSLSHEDLAANIWINDDETAGDGVDNDNNGYVDDVHGWDFSSGDNDPNPVGTDSHGTHVSGIVAARLDNGLGVAGTAGGATIMPLRFYGSGAWTSTVIAAAYAYAVDNGARIVSTSYNVDGFVGDPTFLAGLQYLYDHGGLHFNSAGNNSQLNPPRQTFEQSLLVASTDATDARSGFSNYGTGIDVAAPGSGIFATLPNNQYGAMSGTSMATPNAAAVAALIWSAHPTWTRDQVAAQLLATADNIDAVNPSYVGLLGAGRVNSYRAVTETLPPPTVTSVEGLPANGASTGSTSDSFTIRVDQLLAAATADEASNYELREAGGDGVFGTSDDYLYGLSRPTRYFVGTNGVTLRIAEGALGLGKYRLTAGSGLKNPFGAALDGNADGAGGDAYVHEFSIGMPPLIPVEPWGSLVLASNGFGSIASAGDTDEIRLDLMAGQSLSVAVQPSNALRPEITVQGPSAFHRLQAASANGEAALLQSLLLTENGTYRITTRGINATTGTYGISVALNAAMESEGRLSTSNDSPATAEDLAGSFLPLTGTAERSAVLFGSPIPLTLAVEDFVQTTLAPAWTTQSSTTTGRIRVTGAHGTASGSHALLMDSSPFGATLNEAIWRVDVIGTGKAVLRFSHAAWNDELNTFAGDFVGSYHADGVAISMDGDRWHPVFTPPASMPAGQWQTFEVDLTAAAAAAGLELGAGLRIKFQQYDDFPISTDGRGYDAITLFDERPSDWYRFALLDGQSASVVAHASEAGANIRLELWDANSQLLSVGAGTNSTEVSISNFVDRTTDLAPNSYFVRAQGLGESSLLLVTRNADFDREPNSRLVDAQLLIGNGVLLGYLNGLAGSDPPGAAEAYGPRLPVPADAMDRGHSAAWPVGDELPEDDVVEGVDGRLIIKFRADESREHVRSRVESAGFEWVGDLAFVGAAMIRASGASTVSAALEFWRQQPDVVYVEPDYPLYSMATIPNDPQFNGLYGLHNLGQSGGQVDADIDAPEAWDVFRGSSEVVVAVIDTGVDYRHVDLAANMWRNPGEIAADGIDNDRNGYVDDIYGIDSYNNDSDPWDDQGHGTHVAGTIAAVGNNGVGVTGVNWNARVMALKFLGASGGATSGAISALEYLTVMKTRYGVNVVASNNSWGGGGYSRALHDAIQTSVDAGIPFVAAAGNAGANNDKGTFYPANYDVAGIITVAATDRNDRLASFSNYGATSVDLAAPGVSTLSTTPNNTYGSMSGTSMATPHVTGVIALMAGYNPAASPLELKNALLDAVDPVAELTGRVVSGGRLNAASSLQRVGRGDIYSFEAAAGDIISLRTRTPDATSPAYPNMLDPMIELLDGSGVVLAADDNGDSDGRNAVITYTAHDSGTYYVRVDSVRHSGTYLLTLTGVSAADANPKVTGSSPRDGEVVGLTFPLTYTVDLSEGFHWPSVDASDLVVEGRPARSVRAVDGDTLEFAIDPVTNTGDGVYHVTLPANKLTDLQGHGNTAFAATFRSDTTGPRIVGITWNNTALDASRVVAAGSMVMEVEFDEDLKTPGPGVLRLVETGQGIDYVPHSVSYDASRRRLRAEFGNLPDSAYSLTLFSGDGLLEDLVGNDLDGEPNGPRSDRTTTGNGVAGGSYFLDFFTDAAVITLPPLQRLAPLGGMVSRTDARAAVSQAGDSEDLTVELEAGQTLSVTMTGAAGLEPRVEVITPLGQSLGVSQAAAGEVASLQTLRGNAAGVYRIRTSAAGGTIGIYELRAFVNAALEVTDSSDGRELPIGGSYLDLGRFAVVGRSESSSDVDEYTVDLTGRSGHSLDVVVFGDSRLTSATLLLLDTDGTSILATGTASPLGVRATNIDLAIADFTIPRDGVYTLRVANAPVGEYTLIATDNLRFEFEPNSAASDTLRRISTSAPVIGSLPSPDLSSDVLYYPFDEGRGTATANMAVPGEGPRLATVVGHSLGGVGQFGHALVTRTGIANSVDTGWVTSLGDESWTISFWLDRRAIPNSSSASYLFGDATAGNFRAFINGAAGNGNILLRGPFTEVLLPGGAPLTGPVHVAWVHDSSEKKIHGYVNGALVTTVAQGSFSINGSGTFQIGSYAAQSLESGGLLDEFRVSRSALTASHVAALANAASRLDNYVVQLEAGQAVTLLTETPLLGQMYSLPQIDLELRVLDPSGNVVAADQDSAPDGHNALLGFYAASSGSYRVEVRATAGLGEYLVRMENGPRLLLQLDADAVREDAGNAALTATVSRNTDPSQPLVVNLAPSNTSILRTAGSVTIPAGKTSITVPVDVLDNALLDGTRTVTLLAAEANHLDASVPVIVTDYEQLTTAIAAEWIEDNDGTSATTAIVSRSNLDDLSLSLVVNLTSSHPVVRVPSSVTIPAGQSSVVFALDAVDDGIFDGVKLVTIAGTAAGYISVADTVIVRDPFGGSPGELDTTFDGDGKLTTGFGRGAEQAHSVIVQADGKIVVAGQYGTGESARMTITRYLADGSLDATFDGDGKVALSIGNGTYDYGNAVGAQADGKLVVAGFSGGDFAVVRL
ncbi:MAG: S8 family serine peptidase, partial [Pirellulales bacterium]